MEEMMKHELVRYVVNGDEVSSEGTPHFQGYCELSTQITAKPVARLLHGAHHEARKG